MALRVFLLLILLSLIPACTPSEPDDLRAAARSGHPERITKALELGVNVNQIVNGSTALHAAAESMRAENVKLLLAKGADPQLKDQRGRTAWQLLWGENKDFLSSPEGDCAVALLEGGVKPEALEATTYLHQAAHKVDNSRLIALLIESGIDPMARDQHGWTPLHFAALRGHRGNTEALLSAKADPNAESTKVWEEAGVDPEGVEYVHFRYQVGTRPLDVAELGAGRGRSTPEVLREWGATKNPQVKNVKRRI